MSQIPKYKQGSIIKAEKGTPNVPKEPEKSTYGHLWVDGIDYGNSEEVYNAFARHARSQGLNQGEFYDQWLKALRSGQDVIFGNGNTVNMRPEDMSERRAGKRSNWTKFWDDTFDTRRNHFSDAIATARGFVFTPKEAKPEDLKPKPAFDTSEIILNYNDDPKKKGHRIWSTGHADNQRAIQRVTDALAGLKDPDNSDYTFNDSLKAAYQIAANSGMTPEEYAAAIWGRLQDNDWVGYKDPDNDNDLDWLKAFGIGVAPYQTSAGGSGGSGATDGTASTPTQETPVEQTSPADDEAAKRIAELEAQLAALQTNEPEVIKHNPIPGTQVTYTNPDDEGWSTYTFNVDTGDNYQYNTNRNIATGRSGEQSPAERKSKSTLSIIGKQIGETPLVYNGVNYPIIQEKDTNTYYALTNYGRVKVEQDFINRWLEGKLSEKDTKKISKWPGQPIKTTDKWGRTFGGLVEFWNRLNGPDSYVDMSRQARKDRQLVYKQKRAHSKEDARRIAYERSLNAGGSKDPSKNRYAPKQENGGILKGANGLQFDSNWKPKTFAEIVNDSLFNTQQQSTTPYQTINLTAPKTNQQLQQEQIGSLARQTFGEHQELQYRQTKSNGIPKDEAGDPNYDSTPAWTAAINAGLAALDYGSMAWGRKKIHDQMEKGLKDSLYKKVGPRFHGINTATPIEDAAVARYDQYVQRGLTTPLTSDNVANTAGVLTMQANALQGRDQAVRQQSAATLQRMQANQQIANQQATSDAEVENDFRQRYAGMKMNLAQNDASLTAQTAQSIQNLAREWRTKYDEQLGKQRQLQYNTAVTDATNRSEMDWKNYLRLNQSDAWNTWNGMSTSDRNKYGNDINTWIQQSDYWNDNLQREYENHQQALNNKVLGFYNQYNISPELAWLFRTKYGVPSRKSGGTLSIKQRNRYKNEPSEDIWINQNKATHKLVAKLNDNVIKTFLKTLK